MIYIDLDVDLNAPDTSDGALDWTGVAHMLDIPGAADELSGLAGRRPMLPPSAVLFSPLTTSARQSAKQCSA